MKSKNTILNIEQNFKIINFKIKLIIRNSLNLAFVLNPINNTLTKALKRIDGWDSTIHKPKLENADLFLEH